MKNRISQQCREGVHISRQIELTDEEIKTIIAILRFSSDSCPIESLPEQKIEYDAVKNLISKLEELKGVH